MWLIYLVIPLVGICQGDITIVQLNEFKREILAHIKDSTEIEMKVFKEEIIKEVKDFKDQSLQITNAIGQYLDVLKEDLDFIRITVGSIESIQDDVNAKVSPLERVANHTAKAAAESVLNELKELRYNITTVSNAHNDGVMGSLVNINDTLRSLVDSANGIKKDIALVNEEHEHQIMLMKNSTTELANNLTTQQDNSALSVGNKIEDLSSVLKNNLSLSATQQESQLISIRKSLDELRSNLSVSVGQQEKGIVSIETSISTLEQHVTECNTMSSLILKNISTGIIDIHSDLKNYMKNSQNLEQVNGTISDGVNITTNVAQIKWQTAKCPSDCSQLYDLGMNTSGPAEIFPNGCNTEDSVTILCDQESHGGSWSVLMQRKDGRQPRENFQRTWNDYNHGFGELDGEFWLGLKVIHELTSKSDQELLIMLHDSQWDTLEVAVLES